MNLGVFIGLFLGTTCSSLILAFLPYFCWHRWGRWEEIRGLHIVVLDDFGGKTDKVYRRFERQCKKCGKFQLLKKKSN